ncbi:hypothetical protein [Nitrobacter sp. TKz-YC02]
MSPSAAALNYHVGGGDEAAVVLELTTPFALVVRTGKLLRA